MSKYYHNSTFHHVLYTIIMQHRYNTDLQPADQLILAEFFIKLLTPWRVGDFGWFVKCLWHLVCLVITKKNKNSNYMLMLTNLMPKKQGIKLDYRTWNEKPWHPVSLMTFKGSWGQEHCPSEQPVSFLLISES